MKKLLMPAFVCICALPSLAQSQMAKGYVVTNKGDTVRGEVKLNKKEIDNYYKVTLKDPNGVQKNFKPEKTRAYAIENEQYVTMDSDGEKKFFKVLATGDINFYKLGFESMRMNEPVFEEEYYVARNGEKDLAVIKGSKFKKQMSDWMKDNPEFAEAYGDEKKFDLEKALLAINNYNSWKAGQVK